MSLVFVTGRHIESVARAIEEHALPRPDWVICDVGTAIFRGESSEDLEPVPAYREHQERIIASTPIAALRERLAPIEGLRLQEEERQGRFKLSFYADAERMDELVGRIEREVESASAAYSVVHSVDPFDGKGLIDLLPAGVSKAYALEWLLRGERISAQAVVYAGDTGNDLTALTAGYRAIVVGNADRRLARRVWETHRSSGWTNRLYLAREEATSGLLEGCRWFELIGPGPATASIERWGATPVTSRRTHFRVWAPRRKSVAVEVGDGKESVRSTLSRDDRGYFSGVASPAGPGARYRYVLDEAQAFPDPASRHQPDGVHGASEIRDPRGFPWTDHEWAGVSKRDLILYELHVGTFTQEGTFRAASTRIPELVELGVTAVEVMPVTQSPGRRGWGYDGVDLFAVRDTYGGPDELKAFVDACHAAGLAVILDVVYNHVGPEGNYLARFGPYLSRKHKTPWGEAFNYDERQSEPVRRFICDNAIGWLDEFHLDGLRMDSVHFMQDDSEPTILDEIRRRVSDFADGAGRRIHLIAETNVHDRELLAPDDDRPPHDAIWCDCLMHSIYSLARPELQLTPREYRGASDLVQVLRHGFVYAGRAHERVDEGSRGRTPGTMGEPSPLASLVTALQTHDGVGNHPHGLRLHQLTSTEFQGAAAALTLLHPSLPLVFMGEEWAVSAPFSFFCDFEDDRLRRSVDRGRARQFSPEQWRGAEAPSEDAAFNRAKWDGPRDGHAQMLTWYRQLIALRKTGLSEGWLAEDRMTVRHDVERSVFSLRFECPDGGAVLVQARLVSAAREGVERTGASPAEGEWVEIEGAVLLSSDPDLEARKGQVLLRPDRALITRS